MEICWLNKYSKQFLEKDYLLPGQSVADRLKIIGDTAERILGIPGFSDKVQDYIAKGWISPSTPIWTNFGTNRGLPISCFGSYIPDSIQGILQTTAEVGTMLKNGGGTSGYFGAIRGRGEVISSNGTTHGSKPFLGLFEQLANVINQGSVRRGYFSGYIDIDHKDIEEWLTIRGEGDAIQHLTWGVCVPDQWLNEMEAGDKKKRKIWAKVIQKRFETGLPYIFYTDNANNGESVPETYRGKNRIKASQMCVTSDQRVVSDRGLVTVKELHEQGGNLVLFDNKTYVNASEMRLIEKDADVYEVTLENGMTHKITGYHKLKVNKGYKKSSMIECKDLKIGDKVFVQTNRGVFGTQAMVDEAYLLGLYQSDGTQHNDIIMLDVWENDFDLIDDIQAKFEGIHIKYGCDKYNVKGVNGNVVGVKDNPAPKFRDSIVSISSNVKKKRLASKTLHKALDFRKNVIPQWIWEGNEKTQWAYIKGLLQGDGTVRVGKDIGQINLALTNINKEFLKDIQLIFNNLGLNSKIKILRPSGENLLSDGRGGFKYYKTKSCWRLYVTNAKDCLSIEKNTGFLSRKGVSIEDREYKDNTKKSYKIESIEYLGKEDVYCTTVDTDDHLWVCNGFITSNCTEIFLPSDEDQSFVCDLASLNDTLYDEWKDTDCVEVVTLLLDAAMTEFIEKAEKIKYFERAVAFAKAHRALGIGRIGYHSYLQSRMIPFESLEARNINYEIQKTIYEQALAASKKLADLYGECEETKGTGRRNTTLIAIAPTTSSAFILGQVSQSIEPWTSNLFTKDLAKGKFLMKNQELEKLLKKYDKNTDEVWDSIKINHGSILHLDFLTNLEKNVFKTAKEIDQNEIIIQAGARQKYIDQGQSLNLFISSDKNAKYVNGLLLKAHKLGIKSLYYQHNVNAAQILTRQLLACTSCE